MDICLSQCTIQIVRQMEGFRSSHTTPAGLGWALFEIFSGAILPAIIIYNMMLM